MQKHDKSDPNLSTEIIKGVPDIAQVEYIKNLSHTSKMFLAKNAKGQVTYLIIQDCQQQSIVDGYLKDSSLKDKILNDILGLHPEFVGRVKNVVSKELTPNEEGQMFVLTEILINSKEIDLIKLSNHPQDQEVDGQREISESIPQSFPDKEKENLEKIMVSIKSEIDDKTGEEHKLFHPALNQIYTILKNKETCSDPLFKKMSDPTRTMIILEDKNINCLVVAAALCANPALTTLGIRYNSIGDIGAELISAALKLNTKINEVGLTYNNIGEKGAEFIAAVIKVNNTIKKFYLINNNFGDKGAELIANALKLNKTISIISLSNNKIGDKGAEFIAAALEVNTTLTRVYLQENEFGLESKQLLQKAVKINRRCAVYLEQF